jgi:CheY-like chemotaxis protein
VLLITSDRRFRVLAAALLTQRGCSVTLAERMVGVAARATHEASDVVVLDATTSVTAAAREAEHVEALEPRVGIVIVAEETADTLAATLVLAKWDSFHRLYGAIEAARDRLGLG